MKEIFLELVKEACNGKVIVDGEEWPYSFNTIIEDRDFYENKDNNATLVIKKLDKLIEKLEEYINIVCDQLEYLRDDIVVNRITGDPKVSDLIEPGWLIKKVTILNDIDKEMKKRNTYQGINFL